MDLSGKAGHVRTIPVPDWVYGLVDGWTKAVGIETGLFRRVSSAGRAWGESVTERSVWHIVKEFAAKTGVSKLAPQDLRSALSRRRRRAGADPIPTGPCLGTNDRAVPRLHAAHRLSRERQDRDRASAVSYDSGRVSDHPRGASLLFPDRCLGSASSGRRRSHGQTEHCGIAEAARSGSCQRGAPDLAVPTVRP